jgi:thiol-disulfide isomerase/thioredoxin
MFSGAMGLRPVLLSVTTALAACGGARPTPSDARTTVVSLTRIDCSDCGDEIVSDLRARPGVYDAAFDRRRAEVRVVASPSFDVFTAVKEGAARKGFDVLLGAGRGQYLDVPSFPHGADVRIVTRNGADVPSLEAEVAPGKVTVLDFSASWCGPCRLVDDHMRQVLAARGDVAYRKLEVGDWTSPLARHYLQNVPKLPYVIVYGTTGTKVKTFAGVDLAGIDTAIAAAVAAGRGAPAEGSP